MSLKMVDAPTLKRWMENGEAVVVDVREPAEHSSESIQGAVLLPLGKVSKATLPACAGKKLVVHCRKGGRGGSACQKLLSEDSGLEIYNLEGGIEAWSAAGFTMCHTGKKILPLDRQVQLGIGVILLTINALGYFLNQELVFLSALVGVGLTIAGITGFCGLSRLLAMAPWNKA